MLMNTIVLWLLPVMLGEFFGLGRAAGTLIDIVNIDIDFRMYVMYFEFFFDHA